MDSNIQEEEECMIFVLNNVGSTKVILKKHWCQFVCLVRPPSSSSSTMVTEQQEEEQQQCGTLSQERNIAPPVVLCQEIERDNDTDEYRAAKMTGLSIPSMISFVSEDIGDDECSLISSVSDRARCHERELRVL